MMTVMILTTRDTGTSTILPETSTVDNAAAAMTLERNAHLNMVVDMKQAILELAAMMSTVDKAAATMTMMRNAHLDMVIDVKQAILESAAMMSTVVIATSHLLMEVLDMVANRDTLEVGKMMMIMAVAVRQVLGLRAIHIPVKQTILEPAEVGMNMVIGSMEVAHMVERQRDMVQVKATDGKLLAGLEITTAAAPTGLTNFPMLMTMVVGLVDTAMTMIMPRPVMEVAVQNTVARASRYLEALVTKVMTVTRDEDEDETMITKGICTCFRVVSFYDLQVAPFDGWRPGERQRREGEREKESIRRQRRLITLAFAFN